MVRQRAAGGQATARAAGGAPAKAGLIVVTLEVRVSLESVLPENEKASNLNVQGT
jgi:hypothetical protein